MNVLPHQRGEKSTRHHTGRKKHHGLKYTEHEARILYDPREWRSTAKVLPHLIGMAYHMSWEFYHTRRLKKSAERNGVGNTGQAWEIMSIPTGCDEYGDIIYYKTAVEVRTNNE